VLGEDMFLALTILIREAFDNILQFKGISRDGA